MLNFKRISDPVHGTIGLTQVEVDLINTPAFQRLRNVKQLGLAHYVFPGADYSRFSHSVGVCHVTGRILELLGKVPQTKLTEKEIQRYRIAGLLHDIGHYPYSHATESAVINHYAASLLRSTTSSPKRSPKILPRAFEHERVSKEILLNDDAIKDVLKHHSIKPTEISAVFLRESRPQFANLVSSDLDADRIDYLLRTAHHTGLPYGSVDIDYILSQISLDGENRVCLSAKALRAADHFLLCRYFDYQQVTFHKSVVGFEIILKEIISALLRAGLIDCSAPAISRLIKTGRWAAFDDAFMLDKIRELSVKTNDKHERQRALSILNRLPPKLVAETEYLTKKEGTQRDDFLTKYKYIKEQIPKWAKKFQVNEKLWYPWKSSMELTKIGSHVPVSTIDESSGTDREKLEQAVRVLNVDKRTSRPIMEVQHSLMKVLSDYSCYTIRVYVLLPSSKLKLAPEINGKIKSDLESIGWK